jgi:hypothetical protein
MTLRTSPEVIGFFRAAQTYCSLIEGSKANEFAKEIWLENVLAALAQLYAAAHALPEVESQETAHPADDLFDVGKDEWQSIYQSVGRTLGKAGAYWCYFDPNQPPDAKDEPILGDLADDLADIYRDVKPALRAWEANQDTWLREAVFTCGNVLFVGHWGRHAVNAIRALHPLALLQGL